MKKVLIIAASALAAALFTTSCVETTESESVTALREAKVAHMQALADQARYKAMQDSISAAIKNATSAAELEALLAQYENQLLSWQLDNLKKQNDLLANDNSPVSQLYTNYTTELGTLNSLKFDLFEQELALAKANADLLDAQAYIAEQTAEQNEIIANAQAQIEIYNNYGGLDSAEIKKQRDVLSMSSATLKSDEISKKLLSEEALKTFNDLVDDNYTLDLTKTVTKRAHIETTVPILKTIDTIRMEYANYISTAEAELSPKTLIATNDTVIRTPSEFAYNTQQPKEITYPIYSLEPEVRDTVIARVEDKIDETNADVGKAKTDKESATGLYLDVDNAKTALDNALKEGSGATDQDKADAQKAYDDAVANLNKGLAELEEMQAYLEELNRLLKAYDDAYAAYYSEMKALGSGELVNAYYQAMTAYEEAHDKCYENSAQIQALNDLLKNKELINVQRLIKAQEEKIKDAEDAIEALSALKNGFDPEKNPDVSQSEIYAQFMIEYITEKIAQLEEQIAIQEQIVASAKAALEEALAGESTPAE